MPQSSILSWLSKQSDLPEPQPAKLSSTQIKKDELPTPPPSSQEDVPGTLDSPLRRNSKTQETMTVNAKRSLPTNVELHACKKEDISHLKQLNSLLLPIPYPEKFYREIVEDPLTNNITLLAMWHDSPAVLAKEKGRLIGAIRCKVLDPPPTPDLGKTGPMLYLSTLVVLSPYRNQGIATHMLDVMTRRAVNDYGVSSIGAHVWEANSDALEWYRKRGFTELAREEGYYRRLKPQGAVVMQRRVGVMDLVGG